MPLKLKRQDGSVTPFRNAEYIPFYYLIPKSYFKRSGIELRSIHRNPQEIFRDRAACEFIESDLFKLFVFADLLYCADCKHKLWFHINTINKDIHYFSCSNYLKDYRGTCQTNHRPKSCENQ